MEITVKSFEELSINELHDLLKLRSEIFVVEQNCVYLDIDGKDQKALHVMGTIGNARVAYTRCFPPGEYFEEAAIGRVSVNQAHRSGGYGHQIMKASMQAIDKKFKTKTIKLSAQTYLIPFYESHGFESMGEEYLEDGIPHIEMVKRA